MIPRPGGSYGDYILKVDGLMKKSLRVINAMGDKQHLMAYYSTQDIDNSTLTSPRDVPELSSIVLIPEMYPEFSEDISKAIQEKHMKLNMNSSSGSLLNVIPSPQLSHKRVKSKSNDLKREFMISRMNNGSSDSLLAQSPHYSYLIPASPDFGAKRKINDEDDDSFDGGYGAVWQNKPAQYQTPLLPSQMHIDVAIELESIQNQQKLNLLKQQEQTQNQKMQQKIMSQRKVKSNLSVNNDSDIITHRRTSSHMSVPKTWSNAFVNDQPTANLTDLSKEMVQMDGDGADVPKTWSNAFVDDQPAANVSNLSKEIGGDNILEVETAETSIRLLTAVDEEDTKN